MSTILPRPSVSPLPSFCSVPTVTYRAVSFSAALSQITRWVFGRAPRSSQRDAFLERRAVDLLVEELEEAEPGTVCTEAAEPIAEGNERQPT